MENDSNKILIFFLLKNNSKKVKNLDVWKIYFGYLPTFMVEILIESEKASCHKNQELIKYCATFYGNIFSFTIYFPIATEKCVPLIWTFLSLRQFVSILSCMCNKHLTVN